MISHVQGSPITRKELSIPHGLSWGGWGWDTGLRIIWVTPKLPPITLWECQGNNQEFCCPRWPCSRETTASTASFQHLRPVACSTHSLPASRSESNTPTPHSAMTPPSCGLPTALLQGLELQLLAQGLLFWCPQIWALCGLLTELLGGQGLCRVLQLTRWPGLCSWRHCLLGQDFLAVNMDSHLGTIPTSSHRWVRIKSWVSQGSHQEKLPSENSQGGPGEEGKSIPPGVCEGKLRLLSSEQRAERTGHSDTSLFSFCPQPCPSLGLWGAILPITLSAVSGGTSLTEGLRTSEEVTEFSPASRKIRFNTQREKEIGITPGDEAAKTVPRQVFQKPGSHTHKHTHSAVPWGVWM